MEIINGEIAFTAHGDIVQIRNSEQSVVANYHYDAWGKLLSITDANGNAITSQSHAATLNPLRYRGYVYDNETGFYYLNSRYYDPNLRRFISEDGFVSTGQDITGYNMFVYVYNNPMKYSDHNGLLPDEQLFKLAQIYNNGGYVGLCGGKKPTSQPKELLSVDSFHNKNNSYSLYDNQRTHPQNPFHEQFLVVETSAPAFSLNDSTFSFGSVSTTFMTGGWEYEYCDVSLLDFGKAELGADFSHGNVNLTAMASIWSPSISFKVWDISITLSAHIGSIGGGYKREPNYFNLNLALGVGPGVTIIKDD